VETCEYGRKANILRNRLIKDKNTIFAGVGFLENNK